MVCAKKNKHLTLLFQQYHITICRLERNQKNMYIFKVQTNSNGSYYMILVLWQHIEIYVFYVNDGEEKYNFKM